MVILRSQLVGIPEVALEPPLSVLSERQGLSGTGVIRTLGEYLGRTAILAVGDPSPVGQDKIGGRYGL
jgi:hypothetical protein